MSNENKVVLPEPVMIYRGGCTIDCGEHGHHDMEMLKLIPTGTKLLAEPEVRALLAGVSAPAAQVEEIQWRNIKKVVDALADLCFGSVNDPKWGIAHIAIRHSLVSKDGLDIKALGLEPLATAPQAQAYARDAEQERWMEIGKAIERACIDLPDSTEIVISLERDAGTVTMFDPDGNEHDQFSHEDGFAGVVNAAIEAAVEAAKEQG